MFTIIIEKSGKPYNDARVVAEGPGFFDGTVTMRNSGTNGAFTTNQNWSRAEIIIDGKSRGVYAHGARIVL